jgi:ribosomal protein S27AE
MAGGVLWLGASILNLFDFIDSMPLGDWDVAMLGGAGWLALGYCLYRISLPFHRQNGEIFKSIFDLYRDKVWKMTKIEDGEIDAWLTAWRYYQFRILLTCPRCGATGQPPGRVCDRCGVVVAAFR